MWVRARMPSCDTHRLSSLLRSLNEPSPRADVMFMIVFSWGGGFSQLSFMYVLFSFNIFLITHFRVVLSFHPHLIIRITFANGPGDLGSIPGRVIPKTLKMELDTTLLNTQHYKVRFKGKVEQPREWSSAPPLHLGVVAIEKGAFGSPSTMVANFTYLLCRRGLA